MEALGRHEVVVIGGGPKGLATHLELISNRVDSLLLEGSSQVARSWEPDRINRAGPLAPFGHEITDRGGYRFADFWKEYLGTRNQRKNPERHGFPTVSNFRHYLRWLARKVGSIQTGARVNDLRVCDGGVALDVNEQRRIVADSVVLATGAIGYGEQEFMYDATGLAASSDLVIHHPGQTTETKELREFLGDAKIVAIIGGGLSTPAVVSQLRKIPTVSEIHIFANHDVKPAESSEYFNACDRDGQPVSSIPLKIFNVLTNDKRVKLHDNRMLCEAKEVSGKVHMIFNGSSHGPEEFVADKVISVTGYKFEFGKLPFVANLLRDIDIAWKVPARYPLLDAGRRLVSSDGTVLPIHVIGEGAVMSIGAEERWLPETIESAKRIAECLREVRQRSLDAAFV